MIFGSNNLSHDNQIIISYWKEVFKWYITAYDEYIYHCWKYLLKKSYQSTTGITHQEPEQNNFWMSLKGFSCLNAIFFFRKSYSQKLWLLSQFYPIYWLFVYYIIHLGDRHENCASKWCVKIGLWGILFISSLTI